RRRRPRPPLSRSGTRRPGDGLRPRAAPGASAPRAGPSHAPPARGGSSGLRRFESRRIATTCRERLIFLVAGGLAAEGGVMRTGRTSLGLWIGLAGAFAGIAAIEIDRVFFQPFGID